MSVASNPAYEYHYTALPAPALTDSRLKDRDRRLLGAFYLVAGRGNVVYNKTRKELGKIAGNMAENVVTMVSARLVKFGWLKKTGNGGYSLPATYELIVPDQFTYLKRAPQSVTPSHHCCYSTTEAVVNPLPSHHQALEKRKTHSVLDSHKTPSSTTGVRFQPPTTVAERYPLDTELIYPHGFTSSSATALLSQLPTDQQQIALDEWSGQIEAYRERHIPVSSPLGLLRTIITTLAAGHIAIHAEAVQQHRVRAQVLLKARERAEAEALARLQAANVALPCSKKDFAPGEVKAMLLGAMKGKERPAVSNPAPTTAEGTSTIQDGAASSTEAKPSAAVDPLVDPIPVNSNLTLAMASSDQIEQSTPIVPPETLIASLSDEIASHPESLVKQARQTKLFSADRKNHLTLSQTDSPASTADHTAWIPQEVTVPLSEPTLSLGATHTKDPLSILDSYYTIVTQENTRATDKPITSLQESTKEKMPVNTPDNHVLNQNRSYLPIRPKLTQALPPDKAPPSAVVAGKIIGKIIDCQPFSGGSIRTTKDAEPTIGKVLSIHQTTQPSPDDDPTPSAQVAKTTYHKKSEDEGKNLPQFMVGNNKRQLKPIKNLKPTTTPREEARWDQLTVSGGGDSNQKTVNAPHHPISDTADVTSTVILTIPMTGLQGVGQLADHPWRQRFWHTNWTSPYGLVEKPTAQPVRRGQRLDGSSPPHRLSPTYSTGPDALRLPHQSDTIFSFTPLKPSPHEKENLDRVEHEHVSTKPNGRVNQKTPGVTASSPYSSQCDAVSSHQRVTAHPETRDRHPNNAPIRPKLTKVTHHHPPLGLMVTIGCFPAIATACCWSHTGSMMDWIAQSYRIAVMAILGGLVGSFLNVVIYRLPLMLAAQWRRDSEDTLGINANANPLPKLTLWWPPSHCPVCSGPIKPWHTIPILGFMILRGRCAQCDTPITPRYLYVEMITALVFALLGFSAMEMIPLLGAAVLTATLVALAYIDADTHLLPDSLTQPLLWVGLLFHLVDHRVSLADGVIGAVIGYVVLWLIGWIFRVMTGKDGIGLGDAKLLAALGAWFGWQMLPFILVFAATLGIGVTLIQRVMSTYQRGKSIPFGPYLAVAGCLTVLQGIVSP